MVPIRAALLVLSDTEKLTIPFPVALAPFVTLIQPALLIAVQLHPLEAVTFTVPVPPALGKDWLPDERVNVQ